MQAPTNSDHRCGPILHKLEHPSLNPKRVGDMSSFRPVSEALKDLDIPREYSRLNDANPPSEAMLAALKLWHEQTLSTLSSIRDLIRGSTADGWSAEEQASLISSVSPFAGDDLWNDKALREESEGKRDRRDTEKKADLVHLCS
jgi:hypothetical protein